MTEDQETRSEIGEYEALADDIKKRSDNCQMDVFYLDFLGRAGGIHRKYTRFTPLPSKGEISKRFDDATVKIRNANADFIKNCQCAKKV